MYTRERMVHTTACPPCAFREHVHAGHVVHNAAAVLHVCVHKTYGSKDCDDLCAVSFLGVLTRHAHAVTFVLADFTLAGYHTRHPCKPVAVVRGLAPSQSLIIRSHPACGLREVRTQEICSMALVPVRSPVRRYASAASTASVPIDTYTAIRLLRFLAINPKTLCKAVLAGC